jgi:L-histidine Nalpha-methyltransferase
MSSTTGARQIVLLDYCVDEDTFLADVQAGLSKRPMRLPSKYFYDAEGSRLFDEITELDAYYPTRTEFSIMSSHISEMAEHIGPDALIVEYGSGSSQKTRTLLENLQKPAGYVPIDISRDHLMLAAESLAAGFPSLEILPVCADYTQAFPVPQPSVMPSRTVVYFPGSTIGNMTPDVAVRFLKHTRSVGDSMLLGVDLVKDRAVLERAYNDPEGVTAAFNLNLLRHITDKLEAEIDVKAFHHRAFFDESHSRIEMHLVSERDQIFAVGGRSYSIARGESICTEYSYKYTQETIRELATASGYDVEASWTDENSWFGVFFLVSAS